MSQKKKLGVPLPMTLLMIMMSLIFGVFVGSVLPNFDGVVDPTPFPPVANIAMNQTGIITREIFRQDKEYNNCLGTVLLERTYEQEQSSTVQYTLNVVGGLEIDVSAARSQLEVTIGRVEGETLSEREELVDLVPAGSYYRYQRRWFQVIAQGDIISETSEIIGHFEAVVGLIFSENLDLLPCSQVLTQSTAIPPSTPTAPSPTQEVTWNSSSAKGKQNLSERGITLFLVQPQQPDPTEEPDSSLAATVESASNFNGENSDWNVVTHSFDGIEMVLVPAGCFEIGSTIDQRNYIVSLDFGDPDTFWDELDGGTVCIREPYWIDKYEVSNEQFELLGGISERPSFRSGSALPRENITWFEAVAFCELRDGTLPTEAQWEFAARGTNSYIFPWGNEFDASRVAYGGNEFQTVDVDNYPEGSSWVGAVQLSGNVWEWTTSVYTLFPYTEEAVDSGYRSIRGGSVFAEDGVHAANRGGSAPRQRNTLRGFRCVRST